MGIREPIDPSTAPDAVDPSAAESDARLERMDHVAVLHCEITAATRAFLRALAESDRHRDWADEGFASCAKWLAWRLGINLNTANEKVRAARALEHLPLISAAMERGEISFSKVRALTRVGTSENEAELLDFARAASAAGLERLVRGWKTLSRDDEQRQERMKHARRCFSVFPDDDGMYIVKGRLTPEVGAVLMRAIEAASDALFSESSAEQEAEDTDPAHRRADAVGLLAERALAAGFGRGADPDANHGADVGANHDIEPGAGRDAGPSASGDASPGAHRDVDPDGDFDADRNGNSATAGASAPISGSRAERYQVMLHVEAPTLREQGEPGQSELDDGTRVTAETARRLACDASRVEVHHGPDGTVLDVGRRTRTIPPSLRRALESRDRGCRFPGCGLRFTDAHHIVHWADGGETSLKNTVLLCRSHHRRVHEDGYQVCSDRAGQVVFFTPRGTVLAEAPPTPVLGDDPLERLISGNRARGITPDWRTGAPQWNSDRDIPWAIELAAIEALDPSEPVEPSAPNEPVEPDDPIEPAERAMPAD